MKHSSLIHALKHFGATVEQIQDPAEVAPTWRGLLGTREIHWVQVRQYAERIVLRFCGRAWEQSIDNKDPLWLAMARFLWCKCIKAHDTYLLYFHVAHGLKLSAHVYLEKSGSMRQTYVGQLKDTDGLLLASLRGECPDGIVADWIADKFGR